MKQVPGRRELLPMARNNPQIPAALKPRSAPGSRDNMNLERQQDVRRPILDRLHLWRSVVWRASAIAAIALLGIAAHLVLRFVANTSPTTYDLPLYVVLAAGGVPLVLSLALKLVRRQFGSDLLAGISIVAAVLLEEYLAGASGGVDALGWRGARGVRARARVLGPAGAGASNAARRTSPRQPTRSPRCRSTMCASATN